MYCSAMTTRLLVGMLTPAIRATQLFSSGNADSAKKRERPSRPGTQGPAHRSRFFRGTTSYRNSPRGVNAVAEQKLHARIGVRGGAEARPSTGARDQGMNGMRIASAATTMVLAAVLSSCNGPATTADTGKIADAVKADMNQLVADFDAHDAAKAAGHDGPDVVNMFHGQPNVVGPAADLANTKQLFATYADVRITLANITVDVPASGDLAVLHATYTYTYTDPKTKAPVAE